jgi:hypothetical protein
MPDNPILLTAAKYRARLDKQSADDIKRLIDAYTAMAARLKDKIDLLVLEIEAAGMENLAVEQVARMERYKELMKAIKTELGTYGNYLKTDIDRIAREAISQATLDSHKIGRAHV